MSTTEIPFFEGGSASSGPPRSATVKSCLFVVIVAYFSCVSVLKSLMITLSAFLALYSVNLLHAVATFTLNTCHIIVEHDTFVTFHMC